MHVTYAHTIFACINELPKYFKVCVLGNEWSGLGQKFSYFNKIINEIRQQWNEKIRGPSWSWKTTWKENWDTGNFFKMS